MDEEGVVGAGADSHDVVEPAGLDRAVPVVEGGHAQLPEAVPAPDQGVPVGEDGNAVEGARGDGDGAGGLGRGEGGQARV